ncbi:EF hand domain-containing protein [Toxoplasma gondii TgCatPRC2]|uniref:Calmodulin n=15 Tax=Toxoplasma gondii TaxID=5811 RepID=B9PZX9_TOXGV|nr:EF hand domain-containing protein [Toxoplasma gondii ME49]EPR61351.1 EF hand domain-containing protein [Toxoplasma gondii GT1]ESS33317.1 EF hand domain-containing protein [Toxoplasma gondii VEG]KAF4642621.1 EF hand domain-containing protein [Toxoplasma gondii]KFG32186.1 EF hand domain-containing protein [Toxoplasma gondii GAB2-2007-GAL-DOM2]KFG33925.1 EF hand domain-containing protein [Toxoplasma gondii p89]KFG38313.1 EF hand domain-containing protein [Toxoplasma gondii FOU]KFG59055.1 EF |eukprot:XP_002367837.1 EF hand domain-containing protein [Toxoplasma gondii ME49]
MPPTGPLDLETAGQPTAVELEALRRVFNWIDSDKDGKLSLQEISNALASLGHKMPKQEIEVIIWELDEDLDQHISWDEFLVMYQRSINDPTGLEPRSFFNLVQFLMYDTNFTGEISVEQTLQILFVRFGRELLDQEIQAIFGEEEKGHGGEEKRITLSEYLERVQGRLNKQRRNEKAASVRSR